MAAMRERMRMAEKMRNIKHKLIVMSGKGGVGKCLQRGTAIVTGYGDWQSIEALGTPVVALDEEGQAIVRQKKGLLRRRANINLLHLRSGRTIGLTKDHMLYAYGGWKPLSAFRPGERLATIRRLPEPPGPDEITRDEAIVLGLLLGDGSISHDTPGFTNDDPVILDVLDEAASHLDSHLRVRPRGRIRFNYGVSGGQRGGKSNAAMTLVRRLQVNVGSPEKFIPPPVFRSSNELLALVLRGLFSTDGSAYDDKVEFSSSSPRLAKDVHRALLRFGIHAGLKERASHYVLHGARHPARKSYRLLILGQDVLVFAAKIGFWGRKSKRLQSTVRKLRVRRHNPNLDTIPQETWTDVQAACTGAGISWAQLSKKYGYAKVPSTYGGHSY